MEKGGKGRGRDRGRGMKGDVGGVKEERSGERRKRSGEREGKGNLTHSSSANLRALHSEMPRLLQIHLFLFWQQVHAQLLGTLYVPSCSHGLIYFQADIHDSG